MGSARKLSGIILCGGASSRFGSDKALATYEGEVMVDRAIALLRPFCKRITLVAGRNPYRFWDRLGDGVEVTSDPGEGPAEALRFAIAEEPRRAIVIPVDMPALTGEIIERFIGAADGCCAVLGEKPATMPCIIDRGFLDSDAPNLRRSLDQSGARWLSVSKLGIDQDALINVNRPEDMGRLDA